MVVAKRSNESSLPGMRLSDQSHRDVTSHVSRPLHARRTGNNAADRLRRCRQHRRGCGQRLEEVLEVEVSQQLRPTTPGVSRPQRQVKEVKAIETADERRQLGGDAFEPVVGDVERRQMSQVAERRRKSRDAVTIAAKDAQARQRGRNPRHVADAIVTERQHLESRQPRQSGDRKRAQSRPLRVAGECPQRRQTRDIGGDLAEAVPIDLQYFEANHVENGHRK